jgi:carbonic anhydrase
MRAISYVNFLRDRDNRCETLVIACVDFRFRKHMCELLSYAGYRDFDILTLPGAAKSVSDPVYRESLFQAIETVVRVHETRKIVIVDHMDCAACGGSEAFDNAEAEEAFHARQLNAAHETLKSRFSSLDVEMAYLDWSRLAPVEPAPVCLEKEDSAA